MVVVHETLKKLFKQEADRLKYDMEYHESKYLEAKDRYDDLVRTYQLYRNIPEDKLLEDASSLEVLLCLEDHHDFEED